MRRPVSHAATCIVAAILLVALSSSSGLARVYPGGVNGQPYIIPGRVTVQLEDNVDPARVDKSFGTVSFGPAVLDRVLAKFAVTEARKIFPRHKDRPPINSGLHDLSRFFELSFPDSVDVRAVVSELLQNPSVRHAEPVWAIPFDDVLPDDPDWTNQWHVDKINLRAAWEIETGSDAVLIAIVDSGVLYGHADLTDNIWVNPGEDLDGDGQVYDVDDLNGVDDDGNGYVDDLIGYDFFTGLGQPVWEGEDGGTPDSDPKDFDGHGTHCSGIAAAATNNGTGATGIAGGWYGGIPAMSRGCRIMCLRSGALAEDGLGYVNSNDCATAMDYAVDMGASVINCSWGGSSAQFFAIQNAFAQGVTVVHAAGNDGLDNPDFMDLTLDAGAISVAATRSDDRKAWFSNYGAWVDVSAPGDGIYSTVSNQYSPGYAYYDGTSMAAPMVTGLVALVRSMMPSLSREEVDSIVINTADNIDAVNPSYIGLLGAGRINAYNALIGLANAKFASDVYEGNAPLTVNFTDLSPNSPSSWKWYFGDGDSSEVQHPTHDYAGVGVYDVALIIEDPNGTGAERLQNYIWVQADTAAIDSVEGDRNETVEVPIYLTNTVPVSRIEFSFTSYNEHDIDFTSATVVGCRTDGLFNLSYTGYSSALQSYEITLSGSGGALLPAGSGPVMKVLFSIPGDAPPGTAVPIDTATWTTHIPLITTIYGTYWPESRPGQIQVSSGCCGLYTGGYTGNTNCDIEGKMNLSDITALISRVYVTPEIPLCCEENGNVSGDAEGKLNLSDITGLIDHIYVSQDPTALCQ